MHFSIIVAGDNWEEQLAPFQENNMGDCPEEYLEFYVDGETYPTREEAEEAVGKQKCDDDGKSATAKHVRAEKSVFRAKHKQSDKDPKGSVATR